MVEVKAYANGKVTTAKVDDQLFAHPKHGTRVLGRTLKDALVMYEANQRAGTHKTKTRSEVNGPNHKLWKQKHTGRARMGSQKSPLWRGGGIIFGPRPRDYSFHMPVKARRVALRTALAAKLADGEILVADGWYGAKPGVPSTKSAVAVLKALGADRSALVVTDAHDPVLLRSLRNVAGVDLCVLADLNAHAVLLRKNVIFTPAAFKALPDRFAAAEAKVRVAGSRSAAKQQSTRKAKNGGKGS